MAEWYKSVEKAAPHVGLVIRGAPLLVAALLLVVLPMTGRALAQQVPLVFGVLNQQSVVLTAERWNPILNYVSSVSGVPLRLKLGRTVQETDEMMGRGEFDFIYTNHNFQTEYDTLGYRVIARWGGEPIRCVIAVPLDSLVQGLAELRGKRVAFPSPDAFVGYAVPTVALKKAGVGVEEVFAGSQEGALARLKARRVEAAAVNSRFLAQYSEREGVRFRALHLRALPRVGCRGASTGTGRRRREGTAGAPRHEAGSGRIRDSRAREVARLRDRHGPRLRGRPTRVPPDRAVISSLRVLLLKPAHHLRRQQAIQGAREQPRGRIFARQ